MFLVLQTKKSSLQMPGAAAQVGFSVANINQNVTYELDGSPVRLLPITISGSDSFYSVSISPLYIGTVNITSANLTMDNIIRPGIAVLSAEGVWQAQGNRTVLNSLLATIDCTPIMFNVSSLPPFMNGYYPYIIYLGIFITGDDSGFTESGMIQMNPSSAATVPFTSTTSLGTSTQSFMATTTSTMKADTSKSTPVGATTDTFLATQSPSTTSSAKGTMPMTNIHTPSFSQVDDQNVTNLTSIHTPSTSSLGLGTATSIDASASSSAPFVTPTEQLPYEIIGGAAAGGLLLTGCIIAAIVSVKRGRCCVKKQTSSVELKIPTSTYQELPTDPTRLEYTQPQLPLHNAEYEDSLEFARKNHYATSALQIKGGQGVYSTLQVEDVSGFAMKNHYATSAPQIKGSEDIYSSLQKAAREGSCDLLEIHLSLGVPIDSLNEEGYSPLHLAAMAGHVEACKLLIMNGANVHLTTQDGKTALQLAQEKGHSEVATLL
jgi:hypothetical protein